MGKIPNYTARHDEVPLFGDRIWQHDVTGNYAVVRQIPQPIDHRTGPDKYALYLALEHDVAAMETVSDVTFRRVSGESARTKSKARKIAADILRDNPDGLRDQLQDGALQQQEIELNHCTIRYLEEVST